MNNKSLSVEPDIEVIEEDFLTDLFEEMDLSQIPLSQCRRCTEHYQKNISHKFLEDCPFYEEF